MNFTKTLIMPVTDSVDTVQLVDLLRQNDRKGFNLLYERYAPSLLGIINQLINNLASSEDVLQDVFVKVFKKIDQYDAEKGSFFTWLLNIARRTAIDFLRSKYYKQQTSSQNFEANDYLYTNLSENPTDSSSDISHIIKNLEPKYKEVIHLVYIWGYSQQDVATMLELPLGTVKTRARMALQILRKELENDGH